MELRDEVLSYDPVMRIVLAFYDFVRHNQDWYNRLQNVVANYAKNSSDYDFEYDRKLYSFFYKHLDNKNVRCYVREYDTFYDLTKRCSYILFDYNLNNGNVTKVYRYGEEK